MNYEESLKILDEIRKVKKVLINCHKNPDPDSIGSALAVRRILLDLNKEVEIICPSGELYEPLNYLDDYLVIKKGVDFSSFDFAKFDLFIVLDSSSWWMVTNSEIFEPKGIKTVVLDHHDTNERFGDINLVDTKTSSIGELLYLLFEDWGVEINKIVADQLMVSIVGDTGAFRYPDASQKTFQIVDKLMSLGADKDKAIQHLYRSESYPMIKFYGEVLSRAQLDETGNFFWSAVPYEIFNSLGKPVSAKEASASMFAQIVEGTDFGFVAVEQEKGRLNISFRSRTGFDVSKIAEDLGGGGRIYASAAKIEGPSFDEAVKKVLEVARKYAKKTS